jgi:hypothetical protein
MAESEMASFPTSERAKIDLIVARVKNEQIDKGIARNDISIPGYRPIYWGGRSLGVQPPLFLTPPMCRLPYRNTTRPRDFTGF